MKNPNYLLNENYNLVTSSNLEYIFNNMHIDEIVDLQMIDIPSPDDFYNFLKKTLVKYLIYIYMIMLMIFVIDFLKVLIRILQKEKLLKKK